MRRESEHARKIGLFYLFVYVEKQEEDKASYVNERVIILLVFVRVLFIVLAKAFCSSVVTDMQTAVIVIVITLKIV